MDTVIDEVDQPEDNIIHNVDKDNENTVVEMSACTESERKEPAPPEQQIPCPEGLPCTREEKRKKRWGE
eukprot:5450848-Prorocentrum_lima.AAC.1